MYASYWNDGLVILDIGNGVKGGSAVEPAARLPVQVRPRLAVPAGGGDRRAGLHPRHAHRLAAQATTSSSPTRCSASTRAMRCSRAQPSRAYGRLQVIDVSDIEHPKAVAWYEPEYGGVHNVWVAGDTLYMGAYNAGFHAFDISGELRGDLRAQGREMAQVNTADMEGIVPNAPMTWGVVVKNGLAYVNDFNNGLWIVRIEPKREDAAAARCHEAGARARRGAGAAGRVPRAGRTARRATTSPASRPRRSTGSRSVRFGPGRRSRRARLHDRHPAHRARGPHGLAVSPDGKHVFVSTAHGTPYGSLWKYSTAGRHGSRAGSSWALPRDAAGVARRLLAYVVNFNLHGDMVPSSVSVVATDEMLEVARIPTCVMPHGSRLNAQGTKHYSACMMDDMLVEIDTREPGRVAHFMLRRARSTAWPGPLPRHRRRRGRVRRRHGGHGMEPPKPGDVSLLADLGAAVARRAAGLRRLQQGERDRGDRRRAWTLTRRLPAGDGVYNLAVTHDGRLLVATNKRGQSVSVFDAATREGAQARCRPSGRWSTAWRSRRTTATPSSRSRGSAREPGTVEVIDLRALATVATVDVGPMAGGIDVLPAAR